MTTKQVEIDKIVRDRLAAQKARFEAQLAEMESRATAAEAKAAEIEARAKTWEEAARRLPEVEAEATWSRFGVQDPAVRKRLGALHKAEGGDVPLADWLTAAKEDPLIGGWLAGASSPGGAPPAQAAPAGSAARPAPPSTTAGAAAPPNQAAPNKAQLREQHRALLAAGKREEARAVLAQLTAAPG